eukprot:11733195-Alexandrium_andersonii.AAC.1
MSASLVGSEMCIRDSPPSPPTKISLLAPECAGNCLGTRASDASTASTAVSYTHLTLPTICSV